MGDFQSGYEEDLEFLSETNWKISQVTFKGEVVHVFWAFGKGIMNWCERWKVDMILCIFKGEFMI